VILNFETGTFGNEPPQSRRTLGELAEIFAGSIVDPDAVVYETHGCPGEVEGPPKLLYATTILQPGDVEGEFFMTRGHFHTKADRGELMFTIRGQGALVLMDRNRATWMESMTPGSTHDIDGRHAHRVVNTGDVPLIFLVSWMSDCGHDYQSIKTEGFGKRVIKGPDGPQLV
jgi:glucose-6-phosphate isomerase, archaeal